MRYFFLACLVLFLPQLSNAQDCKTCTVVYENYTGDIVVKTNATACIKGTYSGNIQLSGGILNICGNANIQQLNFVQPSSVCYINPGALVRISTVDGSSDITINNACDSLVILGGNFNRPFSLVNSGNAYLQGGSFNSNVSFNNTDTLIINTSLNLNANGSFVNSGYFVINGNISPNAANMDFRNQCQFRVNGDLNLNGQTMSITGGYFQINNVNINSGKIELGESSIFYVNQINIGGVVNGIGSRSTMVCTQNPNLNKIPSITGNISLCVKTGNFNPIPKTIEAPATVDCHNSIPGSSCNPVPFGYAVFRMIPQQSSDWKNSAIWEMLGDSGWSAAPVGRYPTKGCAVLIGGGKQITVNTNVEIGKLVLGEAAIGASLILDSTKTVSFEVTDTTVLTAQSQIDIYKSTIQLSGMLSGDLNIRSKKGSLVLDLIDPSVVLRMNQSNGGAYNTLSSLTYELKEDAVITLIDTLRIASIMNPINGIMQTNDKLILNADSTQTGVINEGHGNYILGKITLNRYIPAVARRYRFVSSPVKDANLLDLQQEVFITGNNAAGNAVGNTVGQLNSAGFDATSSNEPSAYWYDETASGDLNNGWVAITNETPSLSDYPIVTGRGYRLFIRGDRSDYGRLDGTVMSQNAVTINVKGTPNLGNVSIPISFNNLGPTLWDNGWNQIGNPYPCHLDWQVLFDDSALSANIEPIIWSYDETKNSYISYNALTRTGTWPGGFIASCQSFWVKANGPAADIVVKEKYKTVSTVYFNSLKMETRTDEIVITLIKDSINQDQAILKYKPDALAAKDKYDILKYWGGEVGLSFYNSEDTSYLNLSVRPVDYTHADRIQLYFYADATGEYTMTFNRSTMELFNTGTSLYLFDAYTNEYFNITEGYKHTFSVDINDTASMNFRFSLVFFPSAPPVAEVNYFYGTPSDTSTVLLEWGSLKEPLPTTYSVERGFSSSSFTVLGTLAGTGSTNVASDYEFLDTTITGFTELYYRIGSLDSINTTPEYTPVIRINLNTGEKEVVGTQSDIRVFPNPVSNMLTVQSPGFVSESIKIDIVDITGKQWISQRFAPQGQDKVMVDFASLPQGLYLVQVQSVDGKLSRHRVLKN